MLGLSLCWHIRNCGTTQQQQQKKRLYFICIHPGAVWRFLAQLRWQVKSAVDAVSRHSSLGRYLINQTLFSLGYINHELLKWENCQWFGSSLLGKMPIIPQFNININKARLINFYQAPAWKWTEQQMTRDVCYWLVCHTA